MNPKSHASSRYHYFVFALKESLIILQRVYLIAVSPKRTKPKETQFRHQPSRLFEVRFPVTLWRGWDTLKVSHAARKIISCISRLKLLSARTKKGNWWTELCLLKEIIFRLLKVNNSTALWERKDCGLSPLFIHNNQETFAVHSPPSNSPLICFQEFDQRTSKSRKFDSNCFLFPMIVHKNENRRAVKSEQKVEKKRKKKERKEKERKRNLRSNSVAGMWGGRWSNILNWYFTKVTNGECYKKHLWRSCSTIIFFFAQFAPIYF